MNDGYFFALTITFPDAAAAAAWRAAPLFVENQALVAAKVGVEDPYFFSDAIPRDANGDALVAWAKTQVAGGAHDLTVVEDETRVVARGALEGFDGYQLLQPPALMAAASAARVGGSARVGFFADDGQNDGPVHETFVADASGLSQARAYDWGDVDEASRAALAASFGVDIAAMRAAQADREGDA